MYRIANKNCRRYVENREEVDGNNLFARWHGKVYVVYSYGEHYPMFMYRKGWWYENSDSYSRTTGRHHSNARPYDDDFNGDKPSRNIKPLTTEDMKNIIRREEYGN